MENQNRKPQTWNIVTGEIIDYDDPYKRVGWTDGFPDSMSNKTYFYKFDRESKVDRKTIQNYSIVGVKNGQRHLVEGTRYWPIAQKLVQKYKGDYTNVFPIKRDTLLMKKNVDYLIAKYY